MNILLLQFKNYFDRKIKRFGSLSRYMDYQLGDTISGVNFIPGDGVTTELILNFDTTKLGSPDYLIAAESDEEFTRWFVMESERTRKGQTRFKLRRDLIAENIWGVKNGVSMVNKGYTEWGNSAFFNKEPIGINRIPKTKDYLRDRSVSGWLVAYLPKTGKSEEGATGWEDTSVKFGTSKAQGQYTFDSLDAARTAMGNLNAYIGGMMQVYAGPLSSQGDYYTLQMYEYFLQNGGAWPASTVAATDYHGRFNSEGSNFKDALKAGSDAIYKEVSKRLTPTNYTFKGYSDVTSTMAKYDGTTFTDSSTGLVYSVKMELKELSVSDIGVSSWTNPDLYTIFLKAATAVDGTLWTTQPWSDNINYATIRTQGCTCYYISMTFTQVSDSVYSWKISKSRRQTEDAPYDCICLPYRSDGIQATTKIDGKAVEVDYAANMSLASAMGAYYGSSLYDVQLLPYCPVPDLIGTVGGISVTSSTSGVIYNYDATSKTLVLYCKSINLKTTVSKQLIPARTKQNFICTHYKLVAPNFSSEYEIPVFENDGIYYWNITQTLIPYSPHIQVTPEFSAFNGANLNDSRGLIIGGSLSITQTNSAWAEYLRSNSNYSQIFESQMAYQEYQQKNSMISSAIGSVGGAITTGVTSGIMTGNVGLGVGAGLVSGAAGIADLVTQEQMNQKANEYAREQRELSLNNIKSTPATISKITSINSNFAIWPYIEYSACTDAEYEIVGKYLKMYGMTINQVGTLKDFMNEDYYCSADIILAEGIKGDANYKNQLKSEVSQGFFYEEG